MTPSPALMRSALHDTPTQGTFALRNLPEGTSALHDTVKFRFSPEIPCMPPAHASEGSR